MEQVTFEEAVRGTLEKAVVDVLEPLVEAAVRRATTSETITYSAKEAATVIGVGERQVRRWVAEGRLARIPHMKRVRIPKSEVADFVALAGRHSAR